MKRGHRREKREGRGEGAPAGADGSKQTYKRQHTEEERRGN